MCRRGLVHVLVCVTSACAPSPNVPPARPLQGVLGPGGTCRKVVEGVGGVGDVMDRVAGEESPAYGQQPGLPVLA